MKPLELEMEINFYQENGKNEDYLKNLKEVYRNYYIDFVKVALNEMERAENNSSTQTIMTLLGKLKKEDLAECQISLESFIKMYFEYLNDLKLNNNYVIDLVKFLFRNKEYDICLSIIDQYYNNLNADSLELERRFLGFDVKHEMFFYKCKILSIQGKYELMTNEEKKDYLNEDEIADYDDSMSYYCEKTQPNSDFIDEDPDFNADDVIKEVKSGVSSLEEALGIEQSPKDILIERHKNEIQQYTNDSFTEEEIVHYLMVEYGLSYKEISDIRKYINA